MEDKVKLIPQDESLKLGLIDTEFYEIHIREVMNRFQEDHVEYFEKRDEWLESARDFDFDHEFGSFENSANAHIPVMFIYAKAMHAKLYQILGQHMNFFSVESQHAQFEEKEETIKQFMNWVITKWANRGAGVKPVFDAFLTQLSEEGTGVLKLHWDQWRNTFMGVELEVDEEEALEFFTGDDLEIEEGSRTTAKYKNKKMTIEKEAPRVGTIEIEDFFMPPGFANVEDAPWVAHRIYMTDDDLKLRAQSKKFDKATVKDVITKRQSKYSSESTFNSYTDRRTQAEVEGLGNTQSNEDTIRWDGQNHTVIEFYCRGYVKKDIDQDDFDDLNTFQEDIVIWYHQNTQKVLGWTYLHRITPDGKRPFFKADFIPAKKRAFGVGVYEMVYSSNKYIDAFTNMRLDNGLLSSLQFGMYRAGSTLKPDTFRIEPGEFIPVEDVNDIKFGQFPYLGQFGQNEEAGTHSTIQQMLSLNDIDLGNLGQKGVAGAMRNATGANLVDRQSTIQLHPHFDRLATCLNGLLNSTFKLCRERMPASLIFRVTGEDGKPIFGDVKKEDLQGDFDFDISVDIMSASESEKQQRISLMLQTLLNPTFMQTGLVTPENFYNILKEFLIKHQVKRPDMYITKPEGYQGYKLTPEDRIMKLLLKNYDNPKIEETVRMDEDHNRALEVYAQWEKSDQFGQVDDPKQLAAYAGLKQAHAQMLQAVNSPQTRNMTGSQMPGQGGLPAMPTEGQALSQGVESGPLGGTPQGEVNGPVF